MISNQAQYYSAAAVPRRRQERGSNMSVCVHLFIVEMCVNKSHVKYTHNTIKKKLFVKTKQK